MKQNPCALYFYVHRSSFVRKDVDIFASFFRVEEFDGEVKSKSALPLMLIRQFIFLLMNILGSDVIICQFAAYHSLLPALFGKVFRKKVLIISGGNDAVSFPSIGYGNFNKPLLRTFTAWSYRLCSMVLPKHETLWQTSYDYAEGNPKQQGITAFVPGLRCDHYTITNGYDGKVFFRTTEKSPRSFLTITGAMNYPFQQYLKGIDLILSIAQKFPDCTFTIIGVESEADFPDRSSNVILKKKVRHDELIDIYSKHTFYLQLSMAEGFPNALCESMLCECVPIGSAVFSIPEIISDTGFLLTKRDEKLLEGIMNQALKSDVAALGKKARERIVRNYPIEKRRAEFKKVFSQLRLIEAN